MVSLSFHQPTSFWPARTCFNIYSFCLCTMQLFLILVLFVGSCSILFESSVSDTMVKHLQSADAYRSFTEFRQEASMLRALQHPCIVDLVGINIHPLCFALQLAPLGSLNTVLEEKQKGKGTLSHSSDENSFGVSETVASVSSLQVPVTCLLVTCWLSK